MQLIYTQPTVRYRGLTRALYSDRATGELYPAGTSLPFVGLIPEVSVYPKISDVDNRSESIQASTLPIMQQLALDYAIKHPKFLADLSWERHERDMSKTDEEKDREWTHQLLVKTAYDDKLGRFYHNAANAIDGSMMLAGFVPGMQPAAETYWALKGAKDINNGNYLLGGIEAAPVIGRAVKGAAGMAADAWTNFVLNNSYRTGKWQPVVNDVLTSPIETLTARINGQYPLTFSERRTYLQRLHDLALAAKNFNLEVGENALSHSADPYPEYANDFLLWKLDRFSELFKTRSSYNRYAKRMLGEDGEGSSGMMDFWGNRILQAITKDGNTRLPNDSMERLGSTSAHEYNHAVQDALSSKYLYNETRYSPDYQYFTATEGFKDLGPTFEKFGTPGIRTVKGREYAKWFPEEKNINPKGDYNVEVGVWPTSPNELFSEWAGYRFSNNISPKYSSLSEMSEAVKDFSNKFSETFALSPEELREIMGYVTSKGYKKGGAIHINKKNKGKFTASAKRAGESVQEHAQSVLSDKNATKLLKKRALFAVNAKKWKHKEGGVLKALLGMPLTGVEEVESTDAKVPNFKGIITTTGRGYDEELLKYAYSKLGSLTPELKAIALATWIEESGLNPFALSEDKKFFGINQWGDDRYPRKIINNPTPLLVRAELDKQIQYYLSTINNLTDKKSWHHGGPGSGYKHNINAYNAYIGKEGAKTLESMFRGHSFGYTRPSGKESSYRNRLKVVKQIYNRIR